MMHGEWKMVDMKPCELPQRIATGFTKRLKLWKKLRVCLYYTVQHKLD